MKTGLDDRKYRIDVLIRIMDAPLRAAAARELKTRMPKSDGEK